MATKDEILEEEEEDVDFFSLCDDYQKDPANFGYEDENEPWKPLSEMPSECGRESLEKAFSKTSIDDFGEWLPQMAAYKNSMTFRVRFCTKDKAKNK